MTATTAYPRSTGRELGARHLILAALLGAAIGTGATFTVVQPVTTPAAPAAVAPRDGATTTAGEQYLRWYTRPSTGSGASSVPVPDARGTTTAGEQYVRWYTRPADRAGSTSAGDQYREWFLRDDGDR